MKLKIVRLKTLLKHLTENKNEGKEIINDLIQIICVLIYGKPMDLGDNFYKNIDTIITDLENYITLLERQEEKEKRKKKQNETAKKTKKAGKHTVRKKR